MANFLTELGGAITGGQNPVEGIVKAGAGWLDQRSQEKQAALDRKAAINTAALNAQTSQANTKTALYVGAAVAALVVLLVVFKKRGR